MIPVDDLLRRPHAGLRCIGYVKLALRRKFPDFQSVELPSTKEEAEAWLRNANISRWAEIGKTAFDATREGDVVYGEAEEDGAFVAVLVDARGSFLTSTEQRGCHLRYRKDIGEVRSVQRRT